jgi:hypothetical protein
VLHAPQLVQITAGLTASALLTTPCRPHHTLGILPGRRHTPHTRRLLHSCPRCIGRLQHKSRDAHDAFTVGITAAPETPAGSQTWRYTSAGQHTSAGSCMGVANPWLCVQVLHSAHPAHTCCPCGLQPLPVPPTPVIEPDGSRGWSRGSTRPRPCQPLTGKRQRHSTRQQPQPAVLLRCKLTPLHCLLHIHMLQSTCCAPHVLHAAQPLQGLLVAWKVLLLVARLHTALGQACGVHTGGGAHGCPSSTFLGWVPMWLAAHIARHTAQGGRLLGADSTCTPHPRWCQRCT